MSGTLGRLARCGVFGLPGLVPRLVLGGAATMVGAASQIALPLLTGGIIDRALLARDPRALAVRVLLLAGAAVVATLARGVQDTTVAGLGERARAEVQARLLARLHELPIASLDRDRAGRFQSLLGEDAATAGRLTYQTLGEAWLGAVQLGLMLAVLGARYGRAVVAALALIPVYTVVPLLVSRRLRAASRAALAATAEVHEEFAESVQAVREVRIFGRQAWAVARLRRLLAADVARQTRLVLLRSVAGLDYVIYFAAVAAVYWRGGLAVFAGRLSVGGLVAVVILLGYLESPVRRLTHLGADVQRLAAASERLAEVGETPAAAETDAAAELAAGRHRVAFEGVTFGYGGGPPAVAEISFAAEPGERVAIVGPSGAGKSTLVALLARLYEPQRGRMTIDGRDLRGYRVASLRREIGFVLQETVLFAGTVRENIRFGKLDATDAEIEQSARLAHADAFIRQLARGYDTEVGERGVQLSGGQRQRIGIARVLLRQPGILVLDEAMSALDSEAERLVREALSGLMAGRTTIVVSHRPASFVAADRILVLDGGRLVAAGRHEELERSCPVYRGLLGRLGRAAQEGGAGLATEVTAAEGPGPGVGGAAGEAG